MKSIVQTPIGKLMVIDNDMFARGLKERGYYLEQEIIETELYPIIKQSDVILDIGAHIGYHSVAYAKYNPMADIMSFEPQKEIYNVLLQNIRLNNINNIRPFNVAMGDKIRETTLLQYITDGPNAGIDIEYETENEFNLGGVSIGFGGERVNMITIDSLNLTNLDYIKIDVEGAETLVLMGGEETIRKFKPIICFEYNHKILSPEFIKSLGYTALPTPFEVLLSYGYKRIKPIQYENFIAEF